MVGKSAGILTGSKAPTFDKTPTIKTQNYGSIPSYLQDTGYNIVVNNAKKAQTELATKTKTIMQETNTKLATQVAAKTIADLNKIQNDLTKLMDQNKETLSNEIKYIPETKIPTMKADIAEISKIGTIVSSGIKTIENATLSRMIADTAKLQLMADKDLLKIDVADMKFSVNDILKNSELVSALMNSGKVTLKDLQENKTLPATSIIGTYLDLLGQGKNVDIKPVLSTTKADNTVRYIYKDAISGKNTTVELTPEEYTAISKLKEGYKKQSENFRAIGYNPENRPANVVSITNRAGISLKTEESAKKVGEIVYKELNTDTQVFGVDRYGSGTTVSDLKRHMTSEEQTMGKVYGKLAEGEKIDLKTGNVVKSDGTTKSDNETQTNQQKTIQQLAGDWYFNPAILKDASKDAKYVDDVLLEYTGMNKQDLTSSTTGAIMSVFDDLTRNTNMKLEADGMVKSKLVDKEMNAEDWSVLNSLMTVFNWGVNGTPPDKQKVWETTPEGKRYANAMILKIAQDGETDKVTGTKNTGKYTAIDFAVKNADDIVIKELENKPNAIADLGSLIGVQTSLANRIGADKIAQANEAYYPDISSLTDEEFTAWKQDYRDKTNDKSWQVLTEMKDLAASSAISDNQIINALAFPFLVAGAGELAKGAKGALKLAPEAARTIEKATNTQKLGDFISFTRDYKIAMPEGFKQTSFGELLSSNMLSTQKVRNVAMVPSGNTGAVAKLVKSDVNTDAVKAITREFDNVEDTQSAVKFVNTVVAKDPETMKAAIAELFSSEPIKIRKTFSEAAIASNDVGKTNTAMKLFDDAEQKFIQTSNIVIDDIVKVSNGNQVRAGELLHIKSMEIGRTPIETMVDATQGSKNYDFMINAVNEMKKIDLKQAVKIPEGAPSGATRAISSAERDLNTVMPENIATRIKEVGGTNKYATLTEREIETGITPTKVTIREINNIEDIARMGTEELKAVVDEVNFRAGAKVLDDTKMNTYRQKAISSLSQDPNEVVLPSLEIPDFTKDTRWSTPKSEAWRKDFSKLGLDQADDGKWTWTPTKINGLSDKDFKFLIETNYNDLTPAIKMITPSEIVKANIADARKTALLKNFADVLKIEPKPLTKTEILNNVVKGSQKLTPDTAAKNAIEELKNGNFNEAAKKLALSNKAKSPITIPLDSYKDVSVARILKMGDEGAPADLVKEMAKKRSKYALDELSKVGKDEKLIAFKISQGDELTEAERLRLWNDEKLRALGKDAIYHEKNPNALIKGLTDDAIRSGDEARITKLADEMKKEKEMCVKRNECAGGSSAAKIAAGAAIVGTTVVGAGSGEDTERKTEGTVRITESPLGEIEIMTVKTPMGLMDVTGIAPWQGKDDPRTYEEYMKEKDDWEIFKSENIRNKAPLENVRRMEMPAEAGPVPTNMMGTRNAPIFIGVNDEEENVLKSFQNSLRKHYDDFPDYIPGKQECIQDAQLAIQNWKKDLLSDNDKTNDDWYKDASIIGSYDEKHAMVGISPGEKFAFPEKIHVFDARDAWYEGTVRNYNSWDAGIMDIMDPGRFATEAEQGQSQEEIDDMNLNAYVDYDKTRKIGSFRVNSDTYKKAPNTEVQDMINTRAQGMTDHMTGLPILSNKPYYQSKLDPNIRYNQETYDFRLDVQSKANVIKVEQPKYEGVN